MSTTWCCDCRGIGPPPTCGVGCMARTVAALLAVRVSMSAPCGPGAWPSLPQLKLLRLRVGREPAPVCAEGGVNSALVGSVRCVPVCSLLPSELVFLLPCGSGMTCGQHSVQCRGSRSL